MSAEDILFEIARPFTSWANQLFIGIVLFAIGHKFRRYGIPAFIALSIGYLFFFNFFNYMPDMDATFMRVGWFDFRTLVAFAWLCCIMFACFRIDGWHALFICIMSWTIQQFVFYIALLVGVGTDRTLFWFGIYILLLFLFYPLFYFFLIRRLRDLGEMLRNKQMLVILSLLAVIIFHILSSYMAYAEDAAPENWFGLICIVLMLIVEVGFLGFNRMENDKIVMEQLMREQQRQAEVYRTNVDLINRKCHDLKHFLGAAQTMTAEERAAGVAEISDAIRAYDSIFHTGNETLDNVLSEKQFYCNAHKIQLSCMVSGEDFSFMDKVDLYSLFGNALDNAIEYLSSVPEERRVIVVAQEKWLNFLKVEFSNYCEEQLSFSNGLPVTTKRDRAYHGYGTRSIRYIAEKYGGKCVMAQEGERFTVEVTFRTDRQA